MTHIRLRDGQFPDSPRMVTTTMLKPSASKEGPLRASLPLSTRLRALASGCLAIFVFVLFGGPVCRAQGTYTAASCSQADVNAVIHGPTHTAVNGDTIIIPATGSPCSWTSGITIAGVGIDITGTGTPNTGGGTFGAGTSNTTLIETGSSPFFSFTGLNVSSSTAKVELLTFSTTNTSQNIRGSVTAVGICSTSPPYCPSVRFDNITFTSGKWASALDGGGFAVDNVFGVADHNSMSENPSLANFLVQISFDAWQGIGTYGDNSFASPDTFGTAQTFYMENNAVSGLRLSENDVSPGNSAGGGRWVCRFNQLTNWTGDGLCGAHGTAWGGRFRGMRQVEAYYNTGSGSPNSCVAIDGILSGTGYYLSNTITGTTCVYTVQADIARFIESGAPWNACNGTQPWDQGPWSSTTQCLDQPGHGVGALLEDATPLLAGISCILPGQCWPNPKLDPIYEAGEVTPNGAGFGVANDGSSARVLANRDYYAQVSDVAQTSPTSPFDGSNGTGYGTLANRPPCSSGCIVGAGYWATNSGTWNSYNSQQGTLYVWNGSSWVTQYTPYTYPHPLAAGGTSTTGGGPNPPTGLTAAVE
jgi:hypothetical protein